MPLCFSHFAGNTIRSGYNRYGQKSYMLSADEIYVSIMTCIEEMGHRPQGSAGGLT